MRGLGGFFFILGLGGFILSAFGYQFRLVTAVAESLGVAPGWASGILIVAGIALYIVGRLYDGFQIQSKLIDRADKTHEQQLASLVDLVAQLPESPTSADALQESGSSADAVAAPIEQELLGDLVASAEIQFFEVDDLAIAFNANVETSRWPVAEQLLYACLVLRQLVLHEVDHFENTLVKFLYSVENHPHAFLEGGSPFTIADLARVPVKKGFACSLEVKSGVAQFKLHPKGIGIIKRKVHYYAFTSAMVLYYFLVMKRSADTLYQSQIASIGGLCATALLSNQLTHKNQTHRAFELVNLVRTS